MIELRWLVKEHQYEPGDTDAIKVRVLQYRTKVSERYNKDGWATEIIWSDWQDVPTEES